MRKLMRIAGRILAIAAVVLLAAGLWKRDEIMRLWAVNSLFAEDRIVANFSNMEGAFLTRPVSRGDGPVVPLATGEAMTLPAGAGDWINARAVTSLLVLKDGKIRHESYHLGTAETDRRISWSVAKSYLSALFGILLKEGAIASLDDPVTTYAPLLTGSAYDGASIRNVLNMASGVTFDEDYLDYDSDINRMGREIALGGALDQFAADLKDRFAAPGSTWQYVSIDTHVIGMVIRGATGRSIPDLLSEKIITPLGLEQAPYYVTDGDGVAFVLGGLNITTRDYARFGLLIEQDGRYNGQQIVPADWIAASTRPSAPTKEGKIGYGYQWWVPIGAHDGEFLARGVYGQYIYIDQDRDVVIVSTAADRKFRDKGVNRANIEMFRQIARAL
ncbi:6-aminohexanoate hydrolase [Phaeobacter gallaeciensis]|uniref:6-aminohexanoate hydrolase n=1 Tax=Phaeobacter gallaeciensis TaxID=60890 RepID=A0A1B0ZTM0_9RHOB|nr:MULTISPECIES: serine hydrolase [Phaeobacter]MDF1774058.1 serine hydrolase [Pseudophaeobacter sp. bin_em_oilr2.035]MEE2633170.1 serine hydrolase [Pseudomonadota bacterium]ANP37532.1 6-aminohexanoate hydrolase [Phaeobacter gallaeciensis]MDE4059739.1 serine hydrolase [Phaeobacter gallaeciensis]MDE4122624.1 serine hydrolase [Phaeobacter gallaeciensis]